jgi:hypothetical protein
MPKCLSQVASARRSAGATAIKPVDGILVQMQVLRVPDLTWRWHRRWRERERTPRDHQQSQRAARCAPRNEVVLVEQSGFALIVSDGPGRPIALAAAL